MRVPTAAKSGCSHIFTISRLELAAAARIFTLSSICNEEQKKTRTRALFLSIREAKQLNKYLLIQFARLLALNNRHIKSAFQLCYPQRLKVCFYFARARVYARVREYERRRREMSATIVFARRRLLFEQTPR